MLPLLLTTLALAAPCDAPTPHVDAAEACVKTMTWDARQDGWSLRSLETRASGQPT